MSNTPHAPAPSLCARLEDALIEMTPLDTTLNQHKNTCNRCQELTSMTKSIRAELENVPGPILHQPQWVQEVHVRSARRRKQWLWGSGGLVLATTGLLLLWTLSVERKSTVVSKAPEPPAMDEVAVGASRPPTEQPRKLGSDPSISPEIQSIIDHGGKSPGHCTLSEDTLTCVGFSSFSPNKTEARENARYAAIELLAWFLTKEAVRLDGHGLGTEDADHWAKRLQEIREQYIADAYQPPGFRMPFWKQWQRAAALRMSRHVDVDSLGRDSWNWGEYEGETRESGSEYIGRVEIRMDRSRMQEYLAPLLQSEESSLTYLGITQEDYDALDYDPDPEFQRLVGESER